MCIKIMILTPGDRHTLNDLHVDLNSTSPQTFSLKIARDLGMYKKAKKHVVSNQYFDTSEFVGEEYS